MPETEGPDSPPDVPDEQPEWPPPGEQIALDSEDEQNQPLRAEDAFPFLPKAIG